MQTSINPFRLLMRLFKITYVAIRFGKTYILLRLYRGKGLRRRPLPKRVAAFIVRVLFFRRKPVHTIAYHLRLAFEDLSAAFLKLAQILSVREDIVSKSIIHELRKTQDTLPPFSFKEAMQIIEEDFGQPLYNIFREIEPEPIAAASIAQVHVGYLLSENAKVVVKVRRPGIVKVFHHDLRLLHILGAISEHIPGLRGYRLKRFISEFETYTRREIDFTVEAGQCDHFAGLLKGQSYVMVPAVYHRYSSHRVLTLQFVEGTKPHSHEYLLDKGFSKRDLKELARLGTKLALQQLFIYGYFHGDPHPGNLHIVDRRKWCMLDFGITGSLSEEMQMDMFLFYFFLVLEDFGRAATHLIRLAEPTPGTDIQGFKEEAIRIGKTWVGASFKEYNIGKLVFELLNRASRAGFAFKGDIFIGIKSIVTIEAVGYILDPDFDLSKVSRPLVAEILFERLTRLNLQESMRSFLISIPDFVTLMAETPAKVVSFFRLIGDEGVKVQHLSAPAAVAGKKSSSHSDIGMTALFLGVGSLFFWGPSVMMSVTHVPVFIQQSAPVAGILGFVFAGLFALKSLFKRS